MKYLAAAWFLVVAACAQGQDPAEIDAPVQGQIDAATQVDAPEQQTDAPAVDAPAVDAAATDAAVTDAAVTDAAVTDAMVTDAMVTDAPTDAMVIDAPADAAVDAGTTNPDTCANPPDITAAAMQGTGTTITGDLTGHANNIQPASTCTGYTNDGPDDIYVLTLPTSGRAITATLTCPWDCAVEIVQPCAMTPTCFAGSDTGTAAVEMVNYTTTAAGTFYVIVDSWDPGAYGSYSLTVRVQ